MLRERARERAEAAVRERIDERLGGRPQASDAGTAAKRSNAHQPRADPEFDKQAAEAIPADVRMISGCHDTQTSADVSNVANFQLPDVAPGTAGGALTSSILKVIYAEEKPSAANLTFMDVFLKTRDVVKAKGFEQIPQLSSSRMIDVNQPFDLMSNKFSNQGTRYAVLVGINYETHKQGRLRGCHNDVHQIMKYVTDVGKMPSKNITVLLDDGKSTMPTRANIVRALDELCKKVKPGDTAFVHYSGHGGRVKDDADETGYSSTLCPVDFDTAGQIHDKWLYQHLVCNMPKGTALTCLMDCCHSGTVLDLPYNFVADGEHTEMTPDQQFPFLKLLMLHRALKEAGVERLRDLRDEDKREKVRAAYTSQAGERGVEGLREDFERGARVGREARKERREQRRENRRNH